MAIKKIRIRPPGYVDIMHPETQDSVVLLRKTDESGNTMTLQQHVEGDITEHKVSKGRGIFVGEGAETIVAHGLGVTPTAAFATPIEKTNGYLGEVWIRLDATNLYIGNTGSSTSEFSWVAFA